MNPKIILRFIVIGLVLVILSSMGMVSAQAMLVGTPQTVDEDGRDNSIAIDTTGTPHICYISGSGLNHTSQNFDGTWTAETVQPKTSALVNNPSLAISVTGKPYVVCSWDGGLLSGARLFSRADDGTWIQLGFAFGSLGPDDRPSIALDTSGKVHISHGTEDEWITYSSRPDGEPWTIRENVASLSCSPSLALDAEGNPHISYEFYGSTPHEVRYTSRNPDGTWTTELIDTADIYPAGLSLAFDAADIPHLSYYSAIEDNTYTLQYASRNPDGIWTTEIVNTQIPILNSASTTTLAFDIFGVPHILYCNNHDLEYASRNSDGVWNTVVIGMTEDIHYDLAFDDAGVAHISYTYGALKYFRGISAQSVAQEVLLFSETLTIDDFKSPQNWEAYTNKLNALSDIIEAGNYTQAQEKIANDLMKRNEQWGTDPVALNAQLASISADITVLQTA